MARILKWQDKLVFAFAALFFTVTTAWGLGPRDPAGSESQSSSRVVAVVGSRSAVGVELMGRKPYVRLVRASRTPASLPLTAGAYIAMAGAVDATIATAASGAEMAPECSSGGGGGGTCITNCGTEQCWTIECSDFAGTYVSCYTCGYGTCGEHYTDCR
ncbi:MAG: hypothetical protein ACRD2G_00545 [Terriglobia bacterium]